jgi:hypothetical protein
LGGVFLLPGPRARCGHKKSRYLKSNGFMQITGENLRTSNTIPLVMVFDMRIAINNGFTIVCKPSLRSNLIRKLMRTVDGYPLIVLQRKYNPPAPVCQFGKTNDRKRKIETCLAQQQFAGL